MTVRNIIKVLDYVVVYEKSQTGWAAYVPTSSEWPRPVRSKEDLRSLIREAVGFPLDGLRVDRLGIPQPSAEAEVISVTKR